MRHFILHSILLSNILFLLSTGCTGNNPDGKIKAPDIQWELVSNFGSPDGNALAEFTFRNYGRETYGSSGWALYFNMAPRTLIPACDSAIADVVHINGDWYKLVPRRNFNLAPGDSARIPYAFHGCNIKESDAPCGLYLVLNNGREGKEKIIGIENYTIRPFIRAEQMKCSAGDIEALPTAGNRFQEYKLLQQTEGSTPPEIIPSPVKFEKKNSFFDMDADWKVKYQASLESEADFLLQKVEEISGLKLEMAHEEEVRGPFILLVSDNSPGTAEESYTLLMNGDSVVIRGKPAGVFYGIQSLIALIPYDTYRRKPGKIILPECLIEDAPRFQYRGQHIDVCRNFQTKEELLKIIDLMARYKLNRLHLCLSEDEAWRLEIKALPELTAIASRRGHTHDESSCLPPAYGSGPFPYAADNYGTGYYTQGDFKEIILYAHARHIQVIPSFNFPGHARAAIKAMEARFNRLAAEGKMKEATGFRLIDPEDRSVYRSAQYYNDNVVCVAQESVYHFLATVIDEVLAIYREAGVPLYMVHTGGDEVPEGAWAQSPACGALLAMHPELVDAGNLQTYFFGRITAILEERGLKTAGWEEVVLKKNVGRDNSINPEFKGGNIIPYIWNNLAGSEDLGFRIANAGYPVVLCPVTNFYFDLAYNNDPREPGLYWGGYNNERDAWEFTPYDVTAFHRETSPGKLFDAEDHLTRMVRLEPGAEKNILGLQAQLWHETIRGGEMMEYCLLPKLPAFAERCWAQAPAWEGVQDLGERSATIQKEWKAFSDFLYGEELPKLRYLNGGYNYRVPPAGAVIEEGFLHVNAISPGHIIRYTTDGVVPDSTSAVYTKPFSITGPVRLRVFDKAGHAWRVDDLLIY